MEAVSRSADKKSATYQLCEVRNMLSSDIVDSVIFLNKYNIPQDIKKDATESAFASVIGM